MESVITIAAIKADIGACASDFAMHLELLKAAKQRVNDVIGRGLPIGRRF